MDRRGEKVVSVYWFAILFIVAGAVVYMVGVYYGEPYDVREMEAGLLINQVADCLTEGGFAGVLSEEYKGNNLLDTCKINLEVEDTESWDDDQFYLEIKVSDFMVSDLILIPSGIGDPIDETSFGNSNLKSNCDKEGRNFPICLERSFYTVDESGTNSYAIKILSVVRKTEKNA
tara:strand:+ start:39 stop:560 length:522 start_codon:yes stop_codon:yes gene_type:complete